MSNRLIGGSKWPRITLKLQSDGHIWSINLHQILVTARITFEAIVSKPSRCKAVASGAPQRTATSLFTIEPRLTAISFGRHSRPCWRTYHSAGAVTRSEDGMHPGWRSAVSNTAKVACAQGESSQSAVVRAGPRRGRRHRCLEGRGRRRGGESPRIVWRIACAVRAEFGRSTQLVCRAYRGRTSWTPIRVETRPGRPAAQRQRTQMVGVRASGLSSALRVHQAPLAA
jgi:hypothetical protein